MPQTLPAPMTRRTRLEKFRASDLMTTNPVSVRHGMSARDAALFLDGRGIGAAPVVDEAGRAIGVLSRTDVLLAVIAGVDAAAVREVMTPSVIAVSLDATARDVADAMACHMVRRMFVTDGEGVPVGVVSTTDLFRGLRALWAGSVPRTMPHDLTLTAAKENVPMFKPSRYSSRRFVEELMTECPVHLPPTMSVRSAVSLLDAAGVDAAPVVDSGGRCVGVFTPGDYLRWFAGGPDDPTATAAGRAPANRPDEVRHHMTRRFAEAVLDADEGEINDWMRDADEPFVVVLDRQRRPQGIMGDLDMLVNDAAAETQGVS
ncbi:CBS domain-containing protein [Limnoglobus roseus]|uniref:CBS domain-containing protein n=1 Tax=Limnoglobus roseus TaxID=2598579 RepID=A0A5C1AE50_9BACT|nr:CBS domain-containing protein [Limnoglobus roseus]QEL17511.1 CBS domain-containing protein [Limnoglobus roseus]